MRDVSGTPIAAARVGPRFPLGPVLSCLAILACGPGAEPTPQGLRNVVVVSLDALGARHVGAYGYERATTPALDALAEEGTLFEYAYTNQVWTLTAHLTMLTGLYPQAHGASEKAPAAPGARSLTEELAEIGFATAAFTGAGGYMRPDFGLGRGFEHYVLGTSLAERDTPPRVDWIAEQAERRRRDPRHRFFLFAHYYDVHSDEGTRVPYAAPPPFGLHFLGGRLDWDRRGDTGLLNALQRSGDVRERDLTVLNALYDGGALYADQRGLAPLLAALEANGFGRDTLVVVTSDHGEEIFEHGHCSHQQPYEETARIPLVFAGPGIAAGRRVAQPAQLVDLAPTILSLLELPVPETMQGRDLSPWLRDGAGPPAPEERDVFVDGIFGGIPHVYWRYPSAVTGWVGGERWSYVGAVRYRERASATEFQAEGAGELYRMTEDPGQRHDLAAQRPEVAAELRERLLLWYERNDARVRTLRGPPATGGARPILSEEERKRLEALGYVR